jgi:formate hydrogenlyase subunit 4
METTIFVFYGNEFHVSNLIGAVCYIVLAPFLGGLIAGIDRRVTARMPGRFGPPVLQPFYDVGKLFGKEKITVSNGQDFYILCSLVFMVISGTFFFAGGNLLMMIFTLTVSSAFLVLAGFASNSPYAQLGAERELLQIMAYEPMVLLAAVGFFMVNGSFNVGDIVTSSIFSFPYLIGMFIGFIFIITIKLRKSPFDLSMSHHAHQELVKGLTTELSGKTLGLIEIIHWYENVFLLGFVFIFFAKGSLLYTVLGVGVAIACYFIEIVIDNGFARMKWQFTLKSAWWVTLIFGGGNLFVLYYVRAFLQF